jgi:hypothetical protein
VIHQGDYNAGVLDVAKSSRVSDVEAVERRNGDMDDPNSDSPPMSRVQTGGLNLVIYAALRGMVSRDQGT